MRWLNRRSIKKWVLSLLEHSNLEIIDTIIFHWKINKTAGYHRHLFRLPILEKMPFKKMKAFFSQNTFFIFSNFPNLKICIYWLKNLTIQVQRTLLWNNIIWYAFYNNFVTVNGPREIPFFEKNLVFFPKKILCVLRFVATSVAFYGKFAKRGGVALRYFPSTVDKKWL